MKSLRTLVLEDSLDDADLLLRELRRAGYNVESRRAQSAAGMREALADGPWDVVFSDYSMPGFDAVEALGILKEHDTDLPMIIVSGTIGEETAVEALKSGADDFLVKGKLARLVPALERSLREAATRREQKRLQAQLLVSDRMVTVGALSAGIAHEINNPLAAIVANVEMAGQALKTLVADPMLGGRKELAEARESVEDAREASRRVRDIVRDLKILSRAEEQVRAPVDVRRVIESSVRMAWPEIRHRARLQTDLAPVATVEGNESRLGQVFLNLLVNAAQAIPVGHVADNEIHVVSRTAADGAVEVEVRDTGGGIRPEILPRLFSPFVTTKPAGVGTGLGLSICQRIVHEHGGQISVESTLGQGTTFVVRLPSSTATTTPPPRYEAAEPAPSRRRGKVLVVDDELPVAKSIVRMLRAHDVEVQSSGAMALERLRGGATYDVVLCDLMMPELSGMELYEELARSRPDLAERVVFMTGGVFVPEVRAFLDHIANAKIEKPFEGATLRTLVNERVR